MLRHKPKTNSMPKTNEGYHTKLLTSLRCQSFAITNAESVGICSGNDYRSATGT